jgi:hypothetical protein
MSDPPAHCPICQTPFPEGRLEGLCPACFLSAADELPSQELVRGREIARGGMGIVFEAEQQEAATNRGDEDAAAALVRGRGGA